jgi:hypothetical protein
MISIGKRRHDERDCDMLLQRAHRLDVKVALLDMDHNFKKDLSPAFADGQVNVDADADVTRSVDMTLLDPERKIAIDFDDPSSTSVYLQDMLRVYYVITDIAAPKILNDDWDFENGGTNGRSGWIVNTGTMTQVLGPVYNGFRSMYVAPGAENWGYFPMDGAVSAGNQHPAGNGTGNTYSASVWVFSSTTQTLALINYGAGGKQGPSKSCAANRWTRLTVTFTAGSTVFLSVRDPARVATVAPFYMDLFQITPGTIDAGDLTNQTHYTIPVFTGPVSAVERNSVELSVKAVGKESLGLTNLWSGRNFKKGQEKLWVIKQILSDLMGETHMAIPNAIGGKSPKLSNDLKLGKDDAPWKVAKHLANSMNCQLFYDGRGVAVLRKKPLHAQWELNDKYLTGEPDSAYDLGSTINAVRVIGGIPKKAKKPVKAKAVAQLAHPLSPWRLGRRGSDGIYRPRFLWVEIQDDSLKTVKECKELANTTLKHGLIGGITINADGIMNPRLQEMDPIRVKTDSMNRTMPVRKFTIPLVAGQDGSYGYLRKMRPRGGHKPLPRPHRHRHHGANR